MRQFIRHPVNIPIEVSITGHIALDQMPHAYDIGYGGLAFRYHHNIEPGTLVRIKISYIQPEFESEAKVVWCHKQSQWTELGVEFLTADDAFKSRMVEQICYIENYKQAVKRIEGRILTIQEAATEWISKYATDFPK